VKGKPIIILTWEGTDIKQPSILLNSHHDVVPVVIEKWNYDPFEAFKDENGNIFARGTQDTKALGIQHVLSVVRLKQQGVKLLRTIHVSIVPDEEIGGYDGVAKWVETSHFWDLKVGLALDEGLASPTNDFTVFYGERAPWWIRVKATGPTGHGSRFVENTAMEKLIKVINRMLEFRKEQFETLQKDVHKCGLKLGDVTTLNLTALKGGVTSDGGETYQINVIPTEAEACFDIRIPPTVNLEEFRNQIDQWTSEEGITWKFVQVLNKNTSTPINKENIWWTTMKSTLEKLDLKFDPQIFPAATDSRFIRNKGIPAFGFSPMNNTPILLHDNNEFINEQIFLKGIDIFVHLVQALGNLSEMK